MTSNQNQSEIEIEIEIQKPNGNGNPYPPPTALYEDLTRDPNLFSEKLQSFHNSYGTKFK